METLNMFLKTLLTPVISVSEYISTASVGYKKEKQIQYFVSVQSTLVTDDQQNDSKIKERAKAISELWNND